MPKILVLGPSGSGKSTLARTLPGMTKWQQVVDTDLFGYRLYDVNKIASVAKDRSDSVAHKEWLWVVPPYVIASMMGSSNIIVVGTSDNILDTLAFEWNVVIFLTGDPKLIAERGTLRDKEEERKHSKTSKQYYDHAESWNVDVHVLKTHVLPGAKIIDLDWGKSPREIATRIIGIAKANRGLSSSTPREFKTIADQFLQIVVPNVRKVL
jgi:energy-coupling factor transporter ATP-binding protein EcfA2